MWLISSGERIANGSAKKAKNRQRTILSPEQARPIKARKPHYHKAITNPLSSKKKSQPPPKYALPTLENRAMHARLVCAKALEGKRPCNYLFPILT